MLEIKTLSALPADMSDLVRQSEEEGFVFMRRLENEWNDETNRFDRDGEFLLAAYRNNKTVGICGVNIDPYASQAHVARLRHLYVSPSNRGSDIGSALVSGCLQKLNKGFKLIRLRVPDAETGKFYERFGFRAVDDPTTSHILNV